MGRSAYAEEYLLDYLTSLMRHDGYTTGLILGQNTDQKDYVVHLTRTPPPAAKDVVEEPLIGSPLDVHNESIKYLESINDINENWMADHAKHVTRMLPGGMWVLGIFVVGPGDSLNDDNCVRKLKSIISAIRKSIASNTYLRGNNNQDNLILNFNSLTEKYACKSLENNNAALKPAEWKFQQKATKWYQLEALIDLDHVFPISEEKDPASLKHHLQNILKRLFDTMSSSLVVIEGEARDKHDMIESIGKVSKKSKKDSKNSDGSKDSERALEVGVYIPCLSSNTKSGIKVLSCSASMRMVGQLVSRTFVHQKATIEEATSAVKEDIMRSLASRLEMHWDSLIEDETGSPEENMTLHEPPRRAMVALPQSRVTLSDYLFPGEGAQEALQSLQELLDVEVHESSVQKELELQVDPADFYIRNDMKKEVREITKQTRTSESSNFLFYIGVLVTAILVVIIGVLVHMYH